MIVRQGKDWRIRKLIDGRYIAERFVRDRLAGGEWRGIDISNHEYIWPEKYMHYCVGTMKQAIIALACRGIGADEENK
jgi:hypothetical protein